MTLVGEAAATDELVVVTSEDELADAPGARRRFRSPLTARFVVKRVVGGAISVWGALTIVFVALNMNGNPAAVMVSQSATQEDIDRVSHLLGYDQPLYGQYLTFFRNVLTGTFPDSVRFDTSPVHLVLQRLPSTLILAGTALVVGTAIGLGIGYLAANGRRWFSRQIPLGFIVCLQAMPPVLLGVMLVLVFGVRLGWLPTSGSGSLRYLVLPAVTLAVYIAPPIARVFRASIVSTRTDDHVRTALAKGISPRRVRIRHVGAKAMLPVVNLIGVQAGALLGGAVVIESLFAYPGVGQLAVSSVLNRDYPVVLATVTLVAVGFVVINFLVDVLAAVLDPRIRLE